MRLFPILTALLAFSVLYVIVFEREALHTWSAREIRPTTSEQISTKETVETVAVVALRSSQSMQEQFVVISGTTEANRQVVMRAETRGAIISNPLRKGTSVQEGDVLCRIDPGTRLISLSEAEAALIEAESRLPEARARVSEAKSRLTEAALNLNVAKRLAEDGFASESRIAAAEASTESAKAGVKAAQSQLKGAQAGVQTARTRVAVAEKEIKKLEIRAPFSGQLESDTAEIGSLLQSGDHCATIIQLNPIKLVGFIVETDIGKVKMGAGTRARLATGQVVTGHVTFLSRAADPDTRTFRVEAVVPNPDIAIRDGQTAEIAIAAGQLAVHLIPQSALTLNDDGELGVRLITETGTAMFQPVKIENDSQDGVFISGLDNKADIIVIGQEYVSDGVIVDPTYQGIGN